MRKNVHNYYARKTYLEDLKKKNEQVRWEQTSENKFTMYFIGFYIILHLTHTHTYCTYIVKEKLKKK